LRYYPGAVRPFRFLATAGDYPGFAELTAAARKPEYDAIGIPFEPVGVRIGRLTETIAILKGPSVGTRGICSGCTGMGTPSRDGVRRPACRRSTLPTLSGG
jgi:hypothetical protein